jgi:hypothetical protein
MYAMAKWQEKYNTDNPNFEHDLDTVVIVNYRNFKISE